jgi:hypothetical protein
LSRGNYLFEVIPENLVPDHISALGARCLLDPNFVPFVNKD